MTILPLFWDLELARQLPGFDQASASAYTLARAREYVRAFKAQEAQAYQPETSEPARKTFQVPMPPRRPDDY